MVSLEVIYSFLSNSKTMNRIIILLSLILLVNQVSGGPVTAGATGVAVVGGIIGSAAAALVYPPAAYVAYGLAASAWATITAAFLSPTP